MASSKGLGKGLGALFGDFSQPAEDMETVHILPITKIEPNPNQPRREFDPISLEELAESLRNHGIIQPLTVRRGENGYYQIIAGERRWRAARLIGLQEVPVTVMDVDDQKTMELAMVENLQREDLNPVEEALGFKALIEQYGLTQDEVSEKVGRSRPGITNGLRLLTLPDHILELIATNQLTAGHGRAILVLKDPASQIKAAQKIAALQLSVRQAELMCKSMAKEIVIPTPCADIKLDYIAACEKNLTKQLGRKVKIVNGKRKGKIDIEFYGPEDLQLLLDFLEKMDRNEGSHS